ncbi:MAG: hypothetical protein G8D89_16330 [gamma proteobacterium symbiont of Clathrolucina costata]
MSEDRYFKVLVTRDLTESALIPVTAIDSAAAGDIATSSDTANRFNNLFEVNEGFFGELPYLGDQNEDIKEISKVEYEEMLVKANTSNESNTPQFDNFTRKVAGLKQWGEPDEEGNPFEPSDGVDDSHSCLMDLIDEAREIVSQAKTMFTVICLYPDYATDDHGADLYVEVTEAKDAFQAAEKVRVMASEANSGDISPDDFRVIAVMAGDVTLELDATSF